MSVLYYFILKSIAASLIGNAFSNWFFTTAFGQWTYYQLTKLLNWATLNYNAKQHDKTEKFYKDYPEIAERLSALEKKSNIKK